MVRTGIAQKGPNAGANGTAHAASAPEHSPTPVVALDAAFEARLKRLVAEAMAEQLARITEVAVAQAVKIVEQQTRTVQDSTSVSELPLPTRVVNGLQRMGVFTVAQLTALRAEDILIAPNMGQRSLGQLRHVLGLVGRNLSEHRTGR